MGQPPLEADAARVYAKAWFVWMILTGAMVLLGLLTLWLVGGDDYAGGVTTVLAALWALLIVPAMVVVKSHVLKSAWEARPADPESYLSALIVLWATIAIGILLALVACLWTKAMLPGGVLAAGLVTLLVAVRPSEAALGGGAGEPAA